MTTSHAFEVMFAVKVETSLRYVGSVMCPAPLTLATWSHRLHILARDVNGGAAS
jgi:hypothetical protein